MVGRRPRRSKAEERREAEGAGSDASMAETTKEEETFHWKIQKKKAQTRHDDEITT